MRTAIDLTGQRFGKLVIQRRAPPQPNARRALWEARCDCGGKRIADSWNLRNGASTTCGSCKFRNLAGQRFGRLVAREVMPDDGRRQGRRWRCQCDCGRSTIVRAKDLRDTGNTTSCGCLINRLSVTRGGELSPRQVQTLRELVRYDGLLLQGRLPGLLGVGGVAVFNITRRLEEAGLVVCRKVPRADGTGSRKVLAITPRGNLVAQGRAPATAPIRHRVMAPAAEERAAA